VLGQGLELRQFAFWFLALAYTAHALSDAVLAVSSATGLPEVQTRQEKGVSKKISNKIGEGQAVTFSPTWQNIAPIYMMRSVWPLCFAAFARSMQGKAHSPTLAAASLVE
jgi:hypothetical protein